MFCTRTLDLGLCCTVDWPVAMHIHWFSSKYIILVFQRSEKVEQGSVFCLCLSLALAHNLHFYLDKCIQAFIMSAAYLTLCLTALLQRISILSQNIFVGYNYATAIMIVILINMHILHNRKETSMQNGHTFAEDQHRGPECGQDHAVWAFNHSLRCLSNHSRAHSRGQPWQPYVSLSYSLRSLDLSTLPEYNCQLRLIKLLFIVTYY